MKTSILAWSAFSGVIIGLMAGAVLMTFGYIVGIVLPERFAALAARARLPLLLISFIVLPLIGAVLGYLEGRLKLT